MSLMTSTARVGARALTRPTTTPRLRVVTGAPPRRGDAAFAIFCATLLAAGLVGLLLLNTALAQGSFTLHHLQATSDQLTDTQDALTSRWRRPSRRPTSPRRRSAWGWCRRSPQPSCGSPTARSSAWRSQRQPGPAFTVVTTTRSTARDKADCNDQIDNDKSDRSTPATKPAPLSAATTPARPITR